MDVTMYKFPTLKDGRIAVEEAYFELNRRYRNKETLSPEELDYLDTANTWLATVGNKL